jgi:hypothetical protein
MASNSGSSCLKLLSTGSLPPYLGGEAFEEQKRYFKWKKERIA